MSPPTGPRDPSLPSITVASFGATIAQVLLLRELLVLFHGNEMSTALALAGWLLPTALGSALAARLSSRVAAPESALAILLAILGLTLPGLVLMMRAARVLFAVPAGELAPIGKMVLVCLSVPAPFAVTAGALFGLCWAFRRRGDAEGGSWAKPLAVYLGEATGAAVGGIVFYYLLLSATTALVAAVVVALLPVGASGWILWTHRRRRRAPAARAVCSIAALVVLVLAAVASPLEERSRRWQWGEGLALARDTPFHNIAILRQPEQVTVFTNGLWLFTQPDPASTEPAVHTALLQHPEPVRVLLIGGGLAGHIEEILKHPGIELVDYVEQDPALVRHGEGFLSARARDALQDPRVEMHHEDFAAFLQHHDGRYDVIFLNAGDPINAQMNRFFTVETFRRIEGHLLPGGLLTFSVPGGGDMIGPTHARYLGSMNRTLGNVFSAVAVVPGERARFFAAREQESLTLDPGVLADRLRVRRLDLAHLRMDTLQDLMSPMRLDYTRSLLGQLESSPVNRQFAPVCYLHALRLWAAEWHPRLERALGVAASIRPLALTAGLASVGVLVVLFFWSGRRRYRAAVGLSVFVQGAVALVLQVVLILTFQILEGYAYLQLALVIALFMAGLAVGTLWVAAVGGREERSRTTRRFALLQAGVTVFPFLLVALFSPGGDEALEALSPELTAWLLSAVSLVAGVLGGAHFSLAALASVAAGAQLDRAGGYLYAADLVGAACGAVAAGLVLIPLFGMPATLAQLGLASLVCLVAVLRRPR